jgi:NADPH:quinone reductase-like Zn-dependent oxidoreductase
MGLAMSSVRRYLEFRLLRDRMECMLCLRVFVGCNQLKKFYRMKAGQGALAQYTVAEPATFVSKPSNITHAEAAAFPIAGLTAYVSLVNHGGLKNGDGKRIFVNGGSGGIGSWAVQVSCE